ncbi:MAG: thioesterase family protein [Caldilineales bacterium]
MSDTASSIRLEDFPHHTYDKVRYPDTDRQGHVNNAAFATFCETGRVSFLFDPERPLYPPGAAFVIARLVLDFRGEIRWPGTVQIGTRVARIGRSSLALEQALFQNERLVATAETVIVLMDEETRRSTPLPPATVDALKQLMAAEGG